jgi:hypothetical protein
MYFNFAPFFAKIDTGLKSRRKGLNANPGAEERTINQPKSEASSAVMDRACRSRTIYCH